jgi:hypothetical protein
MNNIKYFFYSDIGIIYYKIFMNQYCNKNVRNYVMHCDNYINKIKEMDSNDIHYEFVDFIINTALYHKKIDNTVESTNIFKEIRNKINNFYNSIYKFTTEDTKIEEVINNFNYDNIKSINEIIFLNLIYLIILIKKDTINFNHINILNNNEIINKIFCKKNSNKIDNFLNNNSIKIINIFSNIKEKNNNINFEFNINKKKKIIKKINKLIFNFIKNETIDILNLIKNYKLYSNNHYIIKIKSYINERFVKNNMIKENNNCMNYIINSTINLFKESLDKNNFYEYITDNEYSSDLYKNIYENKHKMNFEETFFFNKHISLCYNNNEKIRLNINKLSNGSKYNIFYNSLPELNNGDNCIWYTNNKKELNKINKDKLEKNFFKELYEKIYFYQNKKDKLIKININDNELLINNDIELKKLFSLNLNTLIKKNLLIINNTDFLNKVEINNIDKDENKTSLFNILINKDIDKLINYNINSNEYKLENIHPVIAFRLLDKLQFRLISNYNNTFIEDIKVWNVNIKEKDNIQEMIILNDNLYKYIKSVINYVNKHATIFKNKFIKNRIIYVKDVNLYKGNDIIEVESINEINNNNNLLQILKNNININIKILENKINSNFELSIDSSSLNSINNIKLSFIDIIDYKFESEYNYKYFKNIINSKFKKMIILNIYIEVGLKKIIVLKLKEFKYLEKELLKINNLIQEYILFSDVFKIYKNELLNNDNINELIKKQNKIMLSYYKIQILIINLINTLDKIINKNTLIDI